MVYVVGIIFILIIGFFGVSAFLMNESEKEERK